MSNHDGSYILNEVLTLLKDKYGFFDKMEQETKKEFIMEIFKIGYSHDCNAGEILESLGRDLGFCYLCQQLTNDFIDIDPSKTRSKSIFMNYDRENTICKKCNSKHER